MHWLLRHNQLIALNTNANDARLTTSKNMRPTMQNNKLVTQSNAVSGKTKNWQFSSGDGTIASLSDSGSKSLTGLEKAAKRLRKTPQLGRICRCSNMMASPLVSISAALVGAATAASATGIAGIWLASGIDSVLNQLVVEITGQFPTVFKTIGEQVVPSETNQDLKQFLANQSLWCKCEYKCHSYAEQWIGSNDQVWKSNWT